MSGKKTALIFFVLAPLCACLMASFKIYYDIFVWRYRGNETIVEVSPGEGPSSINRRLERKGIIKSARLFYRYTQFKNLSTQFKVGRYRITPGLNMVRVAEILTSGRSITVKVTLPEGKNLYQVAAILQEQGIIASRERFISLCKDPSLLKELTIEGQNCEGRLYPDTYQFSPGSPEKEVIRKLHATFKEKTKHLDFSRSPLNPYEVVILASIVEKETGAAWERPIIAGVFHNRLKRKMRLQSDPTTIYGIWEHYKGNLKRDHLLEKTPYNTYKIPRLPIGPISNPGLASFTAVLNPQKHSYLYFVSQNDGTHVFSKNYREHNEAVKKYQKRRSARRGKSWRNLKSPQR